MLNLFDNPKKPKSPGYQEKRTVKCKNNVLIKKLHNKMIKKKKIQE
jgi:hypothetical protein